MIRLRQLLTEDKNIKSFSTSTTDKYEYKKENDIWYTKLKTSDSWLDMKKQLSKTNYDTAIKILSKYDTTGVVKKDVVKPKEKPNMLDINKSDDSKSKSDDSKSKSDDSKSKSADPKSKSADPKSKSADTSSTAAILMGGLDYRPEDYDINQQKSLLQSSLSVKSSVKSVIAHRYTDLTGVLASIKNNPTATVVLFSAGCSYASTVAKAMADKTKLYIVEPYAKSNNTSNAVQMAVNVGVPSSNVLTGSTSARGLNVVPGATKTPDLAGGVMASHWNALKFVGTLI